MTTTKTLYKYRDLQGNGFKWFVDIVLNERLHACNFQKLRKEKNDPKEGSYYPIISDEDVLKIFEEKIASQKSRLKICSLTEDDNSDKMWKEYAENHKGVIVVVQLDERKCEPINYVETFPLISETEKVNHSEVAKTILKHKRLEFSYEKEVRILTTNRDDYIKVKVKEIIAGKNMPDEEFEFIKKLISKINSGISVKSQKCNENQ